jgi:hypothetical protein
LFQRDGMRDGVVGHQLSRGFLQVDHGGSVTESRVLGRKGGSTGLLGAVLWLSPGCSLAGQGARCQPDTSSMHGMHCVQFRLIAKIIKVRPLTRRTATGRTVLSPVAMLPPNHKADRLAGSPPP